MNYLAVKRGRDIKRQRWQFGAVIFTIGLGVMLFATSFDAYLNLEASYNGTYERLGFADITVTGAEEGFTATAASIEGVEVVEERRQADVPFQVDEATLLGRIVGMPADAQPRINQIDVVSGTYLDSDQPAGVVVETHMAGDFGLDVGDTFLVLGEEVEVIGIGVSAEYIWPARSTQDLFPPPKSFGVVFVNDELIGSASNPAIAEQTLFLYQEDADVASTDEAVQRAADAANASDTLTQAQHPSNSTLQLDVQGFQQLAIAFPTLFLLAAGMAAYIVLTRIVFSQRGVIGTLRASGMSRKTLSRHYLSYGIRLGLVGAAFGVVIGMALAWGLTGLYTDLLGIPDAVREFHLVTLVVGLLFGLVAGSLSSLAPARAVARLEPAEAMRGEAPQDGGRPSLFERLIPPLQRAPVRWRMTLRGIGRNKRRSLSTVLGVVLALTLILASWGMIDTVLSIMDRQFNEIALEDATVVFSVPVGAEQVTSVESDPAVEHAEVVVGLSVTIKYAGNSYGTALEAYQPNTQVHGFDEPLPPDGLVTGAALADQIGVAIGDTVTVEMPTLESSFETELVRFIDEPLGTLAYMSSGGLERAMETTDPPVDPAVLSSPATATVKAIFAPDAQSDTVVRRLEQAPDVAAVVDSRALQEVVESFQVFFYAFVGIMLLFGGAMAFALIFNTISVNVAERSGEFATMRANGLSHSRVAGLIAGENILLTCIGIIPGLIVGYIVAAAFMASYSSDQFAFTIEMRPISFVLSALAMILVAVLSLIPAIRAVGRLNIGEIVRERAV